MISAKPRSQAIQDFLHRLERIGSKFSPVFPSKPQLLSDQVDTGDSPGAIPASFFAMSVGIDWGTEMSYIVAREPCRQDGTRRIWCCSVRGRAPVPTISSLLGCLNPLIVVNDSNGIGSPLDFQLRAVAGQHRIVSAKFSSVEHKSLMPQPPVVRGDEVIASKVFLTRWLARQKISENWLLLADGSACLRAEFEAHHHNVFVVERPVGREGRIRPRITARQNPEHFFDAHLFALLGDYVAATPDLFPRSSATIERRGGNR